MGQRLKLVLPDASEYLFPRLFSLKDETLAVRSKAQDRAFVHGAADYADGMIDSRVLSLKGVISGATRAAYLTNMRALKSALYHEDSKLYQGETTAWNYFVNVKKVLKVKEDYLKGNDYCVSEVEIDLLLADPLWYAATPTSTTITINTDPKTFAVANSGNLAAHPVITITADRTIADLTLQNTSDVPAGATGGLKFRYQDSGLVAAGVVVVDCRAGTVVRGTTNTIRYFSGAFLKLLPGSNSLTWSGVTSGATTVKFEFYPRFI